MRESVSSKGSDLHRCTDSTAVSGVTPTTMSPAAHTGRHRAPPHSAVGVAWSAPRNGPTTLLPRGRRGSSHNHLVHHTASHLLLDATFDVGQQEAQLLRPCGRGTPHHQVSPLEGLDVAVLGNLCPDDLGPLGQHGPHGGGPVPPPAVGQVTEHGPQRPRLVPPRPGSRESRCPTPTRGGDLGRGPSSGQRRTARPRIPGVTHLVRAPGAGPVGTSPHTGTPGTPHPLAHLSAGLGSPLVASEEGECNIPELSGGGVGVDARPTRRSRQMAPRVLVGLRHRRPPIPPARRPGPPDGGPAGTRARHPRRRRSPGPGPRRRPSLPGPHVAGHPTPRRHRRG